MYFRPDTDQSDWQVLSCIRLMQDRGKPDFISRFDWSHLRDIQWWMWCSTKRFQYRIYVFCDAQHPLRDESDFARMQWRPTEEDTLHKPELNDQIKLSLISQDIVLLLFVAACSFGSTVNCCDCCVQIATELYKLYRNNSLWTVDWLQTVKSLSSRSTYRTDSVVQDAIWSLDLWGIEILCGLAEREWIFRIFTHTYSQFI